MIDKKCNQIADKWRNTGNDQFQSGKLLEALISYNKSLCHGHPESPQFALAFANRSAVYLKAKLYQKCMENIELARLSGYPSEKLDKLDDREQKCRKLMENIAPKIPLRENFFKLTYSANKKIPFIVDCLEVREDEKYGRFVVTNRDLKPGDVIAIDEPVFKFTNGFLSERRCGNCLKSNDLSLIPCLKCTRAMYCNPACREEHHNLVHRFDCEAEPFEESKALAVKMLMTGLTIAGSVENLRKILDESTCKTVFDLDLSDPNDKFYKIKVLQAVNALSKVRETEYTLSNPLKEIFEHPKIQSFVKSENDLNFIKKYSKNQLRILDTNLYDMKEHTNFNFGNRSSLGQSIGAGLCLFASLFSHCCDPHAKRITVDNKIAFVVVRPVKSGEQIYISYGYSSYAMSRETRQTYLKSYGFICDCQACSNDVPMLVRQRKMVQFYSEPEHDAMKAEKAVSEFEKTCKFLVKNIRFHPCFETTDSMIYCDHLLHQISKAAIEESELK